MSGEARRTVTASARTAAPIETVWDLVSRATAWKGWGRFTVAELEREGDPPPDGVGAIRRLGFRLGGSREEVVAFEPPTHLGYTVLRGLPVRDYRADVRLASTPSGGTEVSWTSSFEPRWPGTGWLLERFLALLVADLARGVARGAERQP